MERAYVGGPLTFTQIILTGLIPVWFVLLARAVRAVSWLGVATLIAAGTLLKLAWLL